jgi:hypothetical protein
VRKGVSARFARQRSFSLPHCLSVVGLFGKCDN